MEPFYGKCEMPEEKVKSGVITIATEQNGGPTKDPESSPSNLEGAAGFLLFALTSLCVAFVYIHPV